MKAIIAVVATILVVGGIALYVNMSSESAETPEITPVETLETAQPAEAAAINPVSELPAVPEESVSGTTTPPTESLGAASSGRGH